MLFDIHPSSNVPIYEQIVAQVTFAIAADDLTVGSMIPRVRELADKLVVNPNTVARAYQQLEQLGILEARRGRGMEITDKAPEICRTRRQEIVRNRIRQALHEAVGSALSPEEVRLLVEEELAHVNGHHRIRGKH